MGITESDSRHQTLEKIIKKSGCQILNFLIKNFLLMAWTVNDFKTNEESAQEQELRNTQSPPIGGKIHHLTLTFIIQAVLVPWW